MAIGSNRPREVTINEASNNLGFNNSKELSQLLNDYWRSKYKRSVFVRLSNDDLERLAEHFVHERGYQIWDGENIKDPVLPDRSIFISKNVHYVFKRQQRNQKDKMVRRGLSPSDESDADFDDGWEEKSQGERPEGSGPQIMNNPVPEQPEKLRENGKSTNSAPDPVNEVNDQQKPADSISAGHIENRQSGDSAPNATDNEINHASVSTIDYQGQAINNQAETNDRQVKLFDFVVGEVRYELDKEDAANYIVDIMEDISKDEFALKMLYRRAKTSSERDNIRIELKAIRRLENSFGATAERLRMAMMQRR